MRCLGTLLGRSNVSYAREDIMLNVKLGVDGGEAQVESWLTSDKITVRTISARLTAMVVVVRCNKRSQQRQ